MIATYNLTMSREEYQVPTGSGSPAVGTGSFGASAPRDYAAEGGGTMYYICGDCSVRVPLEKGAAIRCQKCGARVLYKERTKRYNFSSSPESEWKWLTFFVGWSNLRRDSTSSERWEGS